jgi:signal peptidase II
MASSRAGVSNCQAVFSSLHERVPTGTATTTRLSRPRAAWVLMLPALAIFTLAQCSGHLVIAHLAVGETHVVNDVLHLTHVRNFGGVFGLFQGHVLAMGTLSGLLVIALAAFIIRNGRVVPGRSARWQVFCAGLFVGGGASNVCDRIIHGAVIDFIDIRGIPSWSYVFNTADVALQVGLWSLALLTLRAAKPAQPAPSAVDDEKLGDG